MLITLLTKSPDPLSRARRDSVQAAEVSPATMSQAAVEEQEATWLQGSLKGSF